MVRATMNRHSASARPARLKSFTTQHAKQPGENLRGRFSDFIDARKQVAFITRKSRVVVLGVAEDRPGKLGSVLFGRCVHSPTEGDVRCTPSRLG